MPFYSGLKYAFRDLDKRRWVANHLLAIQEQQEISLPTKDTEDHLLLATWNIRDFGKSNRRGFGARLRESHYYIAEIISGFDLVAVQEVNDLDELQIVMKILGPDWDYIATDVADIRAGGNGERMAFLYDKRKVLFRNIAGEIVLPTSKLISKTSLEIEDGEVVAGKQFRRTPFIVSFQAGWFKFDLCTVHIYYGADSGEKLEERIAEIHGIASYLGDRADDNLKQGKSLILLGDFNIVHPDHKTMKALTDSGFIVPKNLAKPSNIDNSKYYDQIAFKTQPGVIEWIERESADLPNAGVFDIFQELYKLDEFAHYEEHLLATGNGKDKSGAALKKYYETWRTYQVSDHKPMWVRLSVNNSETYLRNIANPS